MGSNGVVYAIKVGEISKPGLKVMDVKIGKTTNINSTLSQYRRHQRGVEILDLWKPNDDVGLSKCERGLHTIAEHTAFDREREVFTFLKDGYKQFSNEISKLLEKTSIQELEKNGNKKEAKNDTDAKGIDLTKEEAESIGVTGTKPVFLVFKDKKIEVDSWRSATKILSKKIDEDVGDFSKAEEIKGTKKSYFSTNKDEFNRAGKIPHSPYYFEETASAGRHRTIMSRLVRAFGYDEGEVKIFYE